MEVTGREGGEVINQQTDNRKGGQDCAKVHYRFFLFSIFFFFSSLTFSIDFYFLSFFFLSFSFFFFWWYCYWYCPHVLVIH